jgi:PhnB protein
MSQIAIHLVVTDAATAATWYQDAFGAEEISRLSLPDGTTFTVELRIADTEVAVAGEMPARQMRAPINLNATSAAFHLQVPDADAAYERALAAGATEYEPVHDAFWGVRTGQVLDPFGHRWAVNQRIQDVSQEEIARRAAELFSGATG